MDAKKLERFVAARLGEARKAVDGETDGPTRDRATALFESQQALVAVAKKAREDGDVDSDVGWLEPESAVLDWVFGQDPEDVAREVSAQILKGLVLAWCDHPDFDAEWRAAHS